MEHGNEKHHDEHHNHEEHHHKLHEHGDGKVDITIDDKEWTVHRGHHTVASLKELADIPLAYDLDQFMDGKFQPLPDDGAVTIKGGEIFVSHPKDGSSS